MTDTIDIPVETNPLETLVQKIETQDKVKEDYVVTAGSVKYNSADAMLEMISTTGDIVGYTLTDHAHNQISEKLEIPRAYYRKMKSEYGDLLADNINGWLSRKQQTKYLLRTFNYPENKICRAVLSNRYNILDNSDVLYAALEAIKKTGVKVEIVKAEITDARMYLHVVAPEIHIEATNLLDGYLANRSTAVTGNGIISGMVISNSETGEGTMEISARAQILKCRNGLHDRMAKFRKVHLGGTLNTGMIEWSQNTRNKNYELIISQVQDSVKTYLSQEYLGQLTTRLQQYKEIPVEHPTGLIEKVSTELSIGEQHKQSILRYFLQDGDESVLGMMNAVTREAQKMGPDDQFTVESGIFNLLPQMHKWDKPVSKN